MRKKINTDAIILPEIRDGTNPDLMNLGLHMFYYSNYSEEGRSAERSKIQVLEIFE